MEKDDKKRQIEWLMGDIKQYCDRKNRLKMNILLSLIFVYVLGFLIYLYLYVDRGFDVIFPLACILGLLVFVMVTRWIGLKRIGRAKSPQKVLSIYRIMRVSEWICLLGIAILYLFFSDDSIGIKIFILLIIIWCSFSSGLRSLVNIDNSLTTIDGYMSDLDADIDRLEEIMKDDD